MASIDGNKIIDEIKAKRSKTPQNSGTISSNGKVLAEVKNSKPIADKIQSEPPTNKEKFIKQIEDYNDFIVANDLDAEMISPNHDYDFSAFSSNDDWNIESQRVKDRLSDRMEEIKQNEDAGEFQGMELENGIPSHDAVQDMDDEQFKAYEQKYLTPTEGETLLEPLKQIKQSPIVVAKPTISPDTIIPASIESKAPLNMSKPNAFKHSGDMKSNDNTALFKRIERQITADEARPEFSKELADLKALQDEQRNGKPRYKKPSLRNQTSFVRPTTLQGTNQQIKEVQALRDRDKPSTLDRVRSFAAEQSFPVAKTIASAIGSASRLKDQYQKEGAVSIAEDLSNSTMSGLAAPFSARSSKFWKDRLNTPDSEAGRLGSKIGDSAVMGLGGGLLGRGIGTVYKNARYGVEDARKRITRLADDRARTIQQHQTKMDKPWIGASSSGAKTDRPSLTANRQRIYENLTKLPEKKNVLNDGIGTTLKRSIERSLGEKAMIKRNDDQLSELFTKTGSLKKAGSHQKKNWESTPARYQKIGSGLGGVVGLGL